jgi:hypothetical protein
MTWPICIAFAIITVCLAFMLIFKKYIGAFIDRTRKVKYGSGEVEAQSPSQEPVDTTVSSTEERTRQFDSPVLQEQENSTNRELTSVPAPERERFLVRYLSIVKLELAFERIYSVIWGSQISILEHLNDRRTIGRSKEEIKTDFYDEALKKWPFINPYDGYLGFMKASNLIAEKNGILLITNFGVDFLQYLTRIGKSGARSKPG